MSMLCALPLAATLFAGCAQDPALAVGYVEAERVSVAPIDSAQVETVNVRRGDHVEAGDVLAILDSEDAAHAVAQAKAGLEEARAQLRDLEQGSRPEELLALEAALRSADAGHREAAREAERVAGLARRGIATEAERDRAETALETAAARRDMAQAELAVARLPARAERIAAAKAAVERAGAMLDQARWRLSRREIVAPSAGRVEDVLRERGELAGPAAPVIALVPDGGLRLKLYVAETDYARLPLGAVLSVRCDGCPPGLSARVTYASPEPEFTPPVIYSLETRQKLLHLIEARPEPGSDALKPGQIVDVVAAGGSGAP